MTGSEFKHLFEQYLEDTISEQDYKKLMASLEDETNVLQWDQAMNELLSNDHLKGLADQKSQQLALLQMQAFANTPQIAPVKKLMPWKAVRWIAAASIIVALGASVFFWNYKEKNNLTSITPATDSIVNDILPGGEKAMLTLSDGSTISLDDAQKGSITTQGASSIEKRGEGQLVYHSDGKLGKEFLYNTLSTPRGGHYELVLPDGTKVWLNAESSITYPVAFNGTTRKVNITGEAYLEVAPDKSRPFVVDVNNELSIEVLGTHFNINSYADEGQINTTLLEGKIRLTANNNKAVNTILAPRQQAQLSKLNADKRLTVVNNANLEEVMAWKNGYFHFTNTSLESMMRQVERWYDVKVLYPEETPQLRFAGEIKRDLTLSQLLEGLKEMGVNVERKERTIFVKP